MSGYWPRPDDGFGTAPYQTFGTAAYQTVGTTPYQTVGTVPYQTAGTAPYHPDSYGAEVLDPTIPEGLDAHLDTHWDFESDLDQLLRDAAPAPVPPPAPAPVAPVAPVSPSIPRKHGARRRPSRLVRCVRRIQAPRMKVLSLLMAALTAAIVGMVSVLGGLIAYDPLRRLASPGAHGLAGWWPMLVYGPWLVASLSILRAALHYRRSAHSWVVVVLFSAVAVALCVAHAPRTPILMAVAGLPPITALVSFQQLVHQITLTSPTRGAPRQRHAARRTACRTG